MSTMGLRKVLLVSTCLVLSVSGGLSAQEAAVEGAFVEGSAGIFLVDRGSARGDNGLAVALRGGWSSGRFRPIGEVALGTTGLQAQLFINDTKSVFTTAGGEYVLVPGEGELAVSVTAGLRWHEETLLDTMGVATTESAWGGTYAGGLTFRRVIGEKLAFMIDGRLYLSQSVDLAADRSPDRNVMGIIRLGLGIR